MKNPDSNTTSYVNTLLVHYCLELEEHSAQYWINQWVEQYSIEWISLAVTEALYLGRYKAVSVEQILVNWKRRGKTFYHFTKEFERVISRRFPRNLRELKNQPISALVPPTPALSLNKQDMERSERSEAAINSDPQRSLPPGRDISYNLKIAFQQDTLPNYFFKPEEVASLSKLDELEKLQELEELQEVAIPYQSEEVAIPGLSEEWESLTRFEEVAILNPVEESATLNPESLSEPMVSDVQLRSLVESNWLEDKQNVKLPLLEGEPILQFVPKRVQTSLYDKLKAIAESSASKGSTFAVIESLMAQAI
jgi:hypothetical protein